MKRIVKTLLIIISASLMSLFMPIFGQWYSQKTGMEPIGFYAVAFLGGCAMIGLMIFQIWDDKFNK